MIAEFGAFIWLSWWRDPPNTYYPTSGIKVNTGRGLTFASRCGVSPKYKKKTLIKLLRHQPGMFALLSAPPLFAFPIHVPGFVCAILSETSLWSVKAARVVRRKRARSHARVHSVGHPQGPEVFNHTPRSCTDSLFQFQIQTSQSFYGVGFIHLRGGWRQSGGVFKFKLSAGSDSLIAGGGQETVTLSDSESRG